MTRPQHSTGGPEHADLVIHCRRHPRMWIQASVHRARYAAAGAARRIATAYRRRDDSPSPWEPAGAYEARTGDLDEGTAVYVRWLGPEAEARCRKAAGGGA